MERAADEVKRLQVCISDLISVLALPAIWTGQQSSNIVNTLVDAVARMLALDFAYARVNGSADGVYDEAGRLAQDFTAAARRPRELGHALSAWLTGELPTAPRLSSNPFGDGQITIAPFRLGLQGGMGLLIAGSRRIGFPTELESLLVRVAANQATIALQECHRLNEQRQAAEDLERRVAERTAELTDANRELTSLKDQLAAELMELRCAQEELHRTQDALAQVTRVMSMGELSASIAHEINQPLAAIVANGDACLRWLTRKEPNLREARASAERMIRDGNRASDVVRSIRAFASTREVQKKQLDINDVIRNVLKIAHSKLSDQRIALDLDLCETLPPVCGERVQLQQVVLNLVINGTEAMAPITTRARELQISSRNDAAGTVMVSVCDSGTGVHPSDVERLFDAFYSTKPDGMGLGLAISRRIIEAHAGRLWAVRNKSAGMTLLFTLPAATSLEARPDCP
jgi:signal transduction histidine kinase